MRGGWAVLLLAMAGVLLASGPVVRASPQEELPRVHPAPPAGTLPTIAPVRRGFAVKVVEPADGAITFGPTRLRAEVKSEVADQVLDVTFWVGDELVFVDPEAPYQTVYDFGSESRSVVVRAVARHAAGFSVEDAIVTRQLHLNYVVEVRRVRLSLTVTDDDGRPVTGLTQEAFHITEDGEPQTIVEFGTETRPLRIALLVDTSGSMRGRLTQVQLAAAEFLDVLRPEDRAMVIDFDDSVLLLQPLSNAREELRDALMSTFTGGGTAMYDAVHATLRRLAPETERKAIVLLSDGGDTDSVMDRKQAIEAARASDVLLYGIGVGGGSDRSALKSLSAETGGRAYFVGKADELGEVYDRIAEELRSQYIVTYSSSNPVYDGAWRKVSVTASGPGHLQVRTRKGYYAVRAPERPLDAPFPTAAAPVEPSTSAPAATASPAAGSPNPAPPVPPDSSPG
ncbi:MAG: VWA domain-containing protein [Acidobacteriota bacterium]